MEKHIEILSERFCKDSLMALATVDTKGTPWVRTITRTNTNVFFETLDYAH